MLLRCVPSICIFGGVPALLPRLWPPTGLQKWSMTIQGNPVIIHTNYFPISSPQSELVTLLQQCKGSRRLPWEGGTRKDGDGKGAQSQAPPPFPIRPVI